MKEQRIHLAKKVFMEIKYFTILYIFVEWVILLHDCYSLLARPMWRFIFATQRPVCAANTTVTGQSQSHNAVKKFVGVDVTIIMARLGLSRGDEDTKRVIIGSEEVQGLFDEEEPSLDEVKEAFGVFDRNKDGYVDVEELRCTLSEMGYRHVSGSDCRRMIDRYDVDEDEKISFGEFLKLMEDCFL